MARFGWLIAPSYTYVARIGFAEVGVATSHFLNGCYALTTQDAFLFHSDAAGGGFMDGLDFGVGGTKQVYMGPEGRNLIPGSLTITTPEQCSLLLLCVGFLAFLGKMALKKLQA